MGSVKQWKRSGIVALALVLGLLALSGVASGESRGNPSFTLVAFQEHFGEIERGITFLDRLETTDGVAVDGWDGGRCINLDPDSEALTQWMCELVVRLPRGDITAAGPLDFSFEEDIVFAVTGGTGAFANARGEIEVVDRGDGGSFIHFWLRGAGG